MVVVLAIVIIGLCVWLVMEKTGTGQAGTLPLLYFRDIKRARTRKDIPICHGKEVTARKLKYSRLAFHREQSTARRPPAVKFALFDHPL